MIGLNLSVFGGIVMAWFRRTARPVRPARTEDQYDDFGETMPATPGYYREPVVQASPVTMLERFISLVAGILNVLLAIRFVFSLLNVNTSNAFGAFIYNTTNWMTTPFASLFNYNPSSGIGYFDLPAIVAIVVVSLVAWGLISLVRLTRV